MLYVRCQDMLYVTRFTANLWFQFCKPMGKVTTLTAKIWLKNCKRVTTRISMG
jgi:hypothetical protein